MPMAAKLTKAAPTFVVPDVVATAEYYRDKMGFTIFGFFADPPVYAMIARDEVELHFGKIDDGAEMQFNETLRKGLGSDVYIFVDDVHALYDEFRSRGAEITEGPIKRIYNCTE